ncbi:hypothetical protein L7F22_050285 [Adiantum nelumboides]|nr:hypothetical protein [Adiantum nelumboides]
MVNTIVFQPSLLDCWACRDLKKFRQVLKGGGALVLTQSQPLDNALAHGRGSAGPSSFGKDANSSNLFSNSQGKSPAQSWGSATNAFHGPCSPAEVNRRDHYGRTVLHLVSASTEPVSIDYLTALLAHPAINLNLQDHESGWTALHRALYHGNLLTALTLLKRSHPADIRAKDFEGLTPFDLYNSTVHGTNPPKGSTPGDLAGELFTWGANRNFTLGLGTSDDRAFPDRAQLRISEEAEHQIDETRTKLEQKRFRRKAGTKFDKIQVKDVGMTKFATVILTSQPCKNVWVCGIGNTGRIGRAPPTQPTFDVLKDFDETAEAIAVGPEHTMILTTEGDIFTFGFNKFQQLGYALELDQGNVASSSKGILKKERVIGIAAGKLHSAAFTSDALFTWGSNTGQLGYDRAATPSQILPRKVTAITSSMSIVSVALTDYATACLLSSGDVLLLHNDTSFFVRFPQLTFSSQASVYRPRQARPKPSIIKIAAGPNNSIAAISDIGDLWQFTPEHPSEYAQASGTSTGAKANIKPQLIWSVRKNKKVGAARDVGVGSGQDLIIVTESGHVFVRSRKSDVMPQSNNLSNANASSSISVKGKSGWKPVPFLQRVVRVAMNESGGLAAIKIDAKVREVRSRSRTLNDDLRDILAHLKTGSAAEKDGQDIVGDLAEAFACELHITDDDDDAGVMLSSDDDDDDSEVSNLGAQYIAQAQTIAEAGRRWMDRNDQQEVSIVLNPKERMPFGCDMFVVAANRYLPAHRILLSARLPKLASILFDPPIKGSGKMFDGIVIRMRVEKEFAKIKSSATQIRAQLKQLVDALSISGLSHSLDSPVPTSPKPQLSQDMHSFFLANVDKEEGRSNLHDMELQLSDRVVRCHSIMLRRSPFFAALLQPHWTSNRWSNEGVLKVNMSHTRWEVARITLLFLYTDKTYELFENCDSNRQHDEFIDFITEVLAFSNELLIEKLKAICCDFLRERILPSNVAALMTDADFYHVPAFKNLLWIIRLVHWKHERLHRTRAAQHVSNLISLHNDFYFDLDLPLPSLGIIAARVPKRLPRPVESRPLSPTNAAINMHRSSNIQRALQSSSSPMPSPDLKAWQPGIGNTSTQSASTLTNDSSLMFSMDDEMDDSSGESKKQIGKSNDKFSLPPPISSAENDSSPSRGTPWKSRTIEANKSYGKQIQSSPLGSSAPQDLRSIMAAERTMSQRPSPSVDRRSSQRNVFVNERATTAQMSLPLAEGTPPKWSMPAVGRTTSQRSIPLAENPTPQKSLNAADRSGYSWASPSSAKAMPRQSIPPNGSNGWPGPSSSSQAWISSSQQQTMSLADIQAEELRLLKDLTDNQQRAPKSFAELQEEDRRDNERKAKEEEERKAFEIWFEEESKRVKEDQNRQRTVNDQKKRGGGGSSVNKPRGGRGGGRGGRGGKKKSEQNDVL